MAHWGRNAHISFLRELRMGGLGSCGGIHPDKLSRQERLTRDESRGQES